MPRRPLQPLQPQIVELVAFQVSLVSLLRQRGVLTVEDTELTIKAARETLRAVGFEQTQVTDAIEEAIAGALGGAQPSTTSH
jgi:hypothetical protein